MIPNFSSSSGSAPSILPLQDVGSSTAFKDLQDSSSEQWAAARSIQGLRSRRLFIFSLAIALSLRVGILHLILDDRPCTISSVEVKTIVQSDGIIAKFPKSYVPFLLAIYDYWYIQRRKVEPETASGKMDAVAGRVGSHVLPALCLCAAGVLQTLAMAPPRSTFVCPLSSSARTNIPLLQMVGVLIECYILLKIESGIKSRSTDTNARNEIAVVLGAMFLVSKCLLPFRPCSNAYHSSFRQLSYSLVVLLHMQATQSTG